MKIKKYNFEVNQKNAAAGLLYFAKDLMLCPKLIEYGFSRKWRS